MKKIFFAGVVVFIFVVQMSAATKIWDGGGTDGNWTNAANWSGDVAPEADDDIYFPANAKRFSVHNDYFFATNFNSVTIQGGNYTVNGNPFSVMDGINIEGGNTRFNTVISLLSTQTISAEVNASATFVALASSNHDLNINGEGSLIFHSISRIGNINKSGTCHVLIADNSENINSINILSGNLTVDAQMPNTFINVEKSDNQIRSTLSGTGTVGSIHIVNGGVSGGNQTSPKGIFTINGDFDIEQNGTVNIKLGGNVAGQNGYDRFNVNGNVFLNNARFSPVNINNFSPNADETFLIINNDSTDLVNGTFRNLPEGAKVFDSANRRYKISYSGGDGNDVVLRTVKNTAYDFDGDGKADIANFRSSDGTWNILNSGNNSNSVRQFGLATDKLASADFDGDGKTDIAVFRPTEGVWYILNSTDATIRYVHFGLNGDVPMPNDFDGDGKADVSVFRPSDGVWYQILSANNQFSARQFGQFGDIPMRADFDGDGLGDLSVFRPAEGTWHIWSSENQNYTGLQFGTNGDVPLSADFDGDGKNDFAVFRPSDDADEPDFYILRSSDFVYYGISWGITDDLPVIADYDGDNKSDIAIFRPDSNEWYLLQSNDGFRAINFGQLGVQPVF